ncbi:MAG: hypothetical protein WBD22_03385 [Pyrinomonadaceae bacterium]
MSERRLVTTWLLFRLPENVVDDCHVSCGIWSVDDFGESYDKQWIGFFLCDDPGSTLTIEHLVNDATGFRYRVTLISRLTDANGCLRDDLWVSPSYVQHDDFVENEKGREFEADYFFND